MNEQYFYIRIIVQLCRNPTETQNGIATAMTCTEIGIATAMTLRLALLLQ